jgi:hypothetical protein
VEDLRLLVKEKFHRQRTEVTEYAKLRPSTQQSCEAIVTFCPQRSSHFCLPATCASQRKTGCHGFCLSAYELTRPSTFVIPNTASLLPTRAEVGVYFVPNADWLVELAGGRTMRTLDLSWKKLQTRAGIMQPKAAQPMENHTSSSSIHSGRQRWQIQQSVVRWKAGNSEGSRDPRRHRRPWASIIHCVHVHSR